jgi:uncharacterized protein YjbI with pentapeptide repeats
MQTTDIATLLGQVANSFYQLSVAAEVGNEDYYEKLSKEVNDVKEEIDFSVGLLPKIKEVEAIRISINCAYEQVKAVKNDGEKTVCNAEIASLVNDAYEKISDAQNKLREESWFEQSVLFDDDNKDVLEDFLKKRKFYGNLSDTEWEERFRTIIYDIAEISDRNFNNFIYCGNMGGDKPLYDKKIKNLRFVECDFTNAKLDKLYLNNLFRDSILDGANIRSSFLYGCSRNSSFVNADFSNSIFFYENIGFNDCDLTDANFSGVMLAINEDKDTNKFYYSKYRKEKDSRKKYNSSFAKSTLVNVNFSYAKLQVTNFRDTNCENANFFGANLCYADFTSANLEGADFRGADLEHVKLTKEQVMQAKNLDMAKNVSSEIRNFMREEREARLSLAQEQGGELALAKQGGELALSAASGAQLEEAMRPAQRGFWSRLFGSKEQA